MTRTCVGYERLRVNDNTGTGTQDAEANSAGEEASTARKDEKE